MMILQVFVLGFFTALALAGTIPSSIQGRANHTIKATIANTLSPMDIPDDVPLGVDRQCRLYGVPGEQYSGTIAIYARDWGAHGQCGKGLLDNLRGGKCCTRLYSNPHITSPPLLSHLFNQYM